MATHAERILGAIIAKDNPRKDFLSIAMLRLEDEHFSSPELRLIFRFLRRYFDHTGEVMPLETFVQALQDNDTIDAAKILRFQTVFQNLMESGFGEADFRWSIDELREELTRRKTGTVITEAMEILERGYEVGRDFYKGHVDARSYLMSKLHELDRADVGGEAPEGNIFVEQDEIIADYESRKNNTSTKGILTGIRCIDDRTDGWYNGELVVVAAYYNVGKSQFVTQTAWHTAVVQKKNVFFATSETLRPQVMRRIIARHSRLPMFGKPEGINSADIKKGTLSPQDEKILRDVVEDWRCNSEYGQLNVVQIPPHSKLSYLDNRLREWSKEVDVSLAVNDYLALLTAETRRASEREEFNEIIRDAKGIAQGFMDGRGIPFVSPWQITRTSYEAASRVGYYTKGALSDTSEIDKSSDTVIALLRDEDNNRDMRIQFLKMRDDDYPPIQQVSIDLRSTYIGTHSAAPSLAPSGSSSDDLMSLIA